MGHDGIDKKLATHNGIVVCNTPGVLDISVAEHTLWLMGTLARRISSLEARFRAGSFAGEIGGELHGKRLGILGFRRIGRRVAKMAAFGLGMRPWAADERTLSDLEKTEGCGFLDLQSSCGLERYTCDPEELFRECDYWRVFTKVN